MLVAIEGTPLSIPYKFDNIDVQSAKQCNDFTGTFYAPRAMSDQSVITQNRYDNCKIDCNETKTEEAILFRSNIVP